MSNKAPNPITRKEQFYSAIAGLSEAPDAVTREELFLDAIADAVSVTELPEVTAVDNGKMLVVRSGKWVKAYPETASITSQVYALPSNVGATGNAVDITNLIKNRNVYTVLSVQDQDDNSVFYRFQLYQFYTTSAIAALIVTYGNGNPVPVGTRVKVTIGYVG